MRFFESFASFLGTSLTPVSLVISSLFLIPFVRPLRMLRPRRFIRTLTDLPDGAKSSPLKALSVALAGTLGVGNITGVTSALLTGGPGAVFWMWIGCIAVLPVKYAEVSLAVRYRKRRNDDWVGGAMYYMRDGLADCGHPKLGLAVGSVFAVLCCLNSLVTGNLVQANAAVSAVPASWRLPAAFLLMLMTALAFLYGTNKVERITCRLIPPLSLLYFLLSLGIILANAPLVPSIFRGIVSAAFSSRAVLGAAAGFSVREALRFGVMRGIFSNEAGCGTSPTAHASAETKSPHHQAAWGIVEAGFDTLVLCTVTALVLLIGDARFGLIPWHHEVDASPVTLGIFSSLTGDWAAVFLSVSILLFAYATILAQSFYGIRAIGFLTDKKIPQFVYAVLSVVSPLIGAVITAPVMWLTADTLLGIMTAVNAVILIVLRRSCRSPDPRKVRRQPASRC